MKHLIIRIISLAFLVLGMQAQAMEVVELKQANSNKVVFKVRFANGSVSDPAGKQGLTYATASLMSQGGAGGVSYADIQDILHPWAAGYGAAVDKQVTTFTFQVPAVFVDEFYPILKNVLLAPDFTDKDFSRVMKNQQNYVDQVVRASSDEDYRVICNTSARAPLKQLRASAWKTSGAIIKMPLPGTMSVSESPATTMMPCLRHSKPTWQSFPKRPSHP
jgi:hypothetical protein